MKRGSKEANVGRDGVKRWRDVTACAGFETELRGGMRTQFARKGLSRQCEERDHVKRGHAWKGDEVT